MEGNDKVNSQRDLFLQLRKEFLLLHLVWHRNKNQHRRSVWWKRLNMMKRNCGQVLEILQKPSVEKTEEVIRLYKLMNDFNKRQLSKTYHDFNGVIALGQFVTLGVTLIGLLSRVFSTYKLVLALFRIRFQDVGCLDRTISIKARKIPVSLGENQPYPGMEEIGEEIIEAPVQATTRNAVTVTETLLPSKKVSKKKKKKSKSVIDSIFG
ncbi:hypothetical protein HG536_0C01030 [Torulaspora globosa]|uniref:RNase MRP protein 1 RNA binding domain-containing protein n=1 Tax=Torulaspora globosa TaxID=48254 RepID=A0A7G3ZEK0_9SACH|nr:uncharacterized protein HG536_0C01030 [Torulaspora globosa]QLL31936.1 hypothetical protein HG536_0C01030 [Torulaspora globosa]